MRIAQIKKWMNMLCGKGVLHIRKGIGTQYSLEEVKGFYIDYSGKVTTRQINENGVPYTRLADGRCECIPITVIQYGLGCYEKFLSGDESYREKFLIAADYMRDTQDELGRWDAFRAQKSHDYYSSMVQGEGVSLMLRAYILTGKSDYLKAARKAYEIMIVPVEQGGTAECCEGQILLMEATDKPMVLNGAIYSMFGALDMAVFTGGAAEKEILDVIMAGIREKLPQYDIGYWSNYDLGGRIASPFYHQLHITQLRVLHRIFGDPCFAEMAQRFEKYYANKFCYWRAFVKKVFQKLFEKNDAIPIIE